MEGANAFYVTESMLNLALCNTVIPEEDAGSHNGIRYEAASPDEATLVDAAKNIGMHGLRWFALCLGFTLIKRNQRTMWVRNEHSGDVAEYELLALNEFTGERKRMSVVVRLPTGMATDENDVIRLWCRFCMSSIVGGLRLYVKGADTIIETLLAPNQPLYEPTKNQLNDFANEGTW